MQKYDILLLDADRTLFDFDKSQEDALKFSLENFLNKEQTFSNAILNRYRQISHQLWGEYELGILSQETLQIRRFQMLFEELHISANPDLANQRYLDKLGEGTHLLPGAEELCCSLSPFCKLYLATNGISRSQHSRLEKSAIRDYISDIFVSEDIGFRKPQKEYFDCIFSSIGLPSKDRVLMIGDSLSSDIQGGINIGIDTCWFNPNHLSGKGIPYTYEIDSLSSVYSLIFPEKK